MRLQHTLMWKRRLTIQEVYIFDVLAHVLLDLSDNHCQTLVNLFLYDHVVEMTR